MKLSPLILFLVLILALVVATTASRWSEGFITLNQDYGALYSVSVDAYDNTSKITKLHDDIFYDKRNGNVVVVEEDAESNVSKINIIPRDLTANTITFKRGTGVTKFTQKTSESLVRTIAPTYGGYVTTGVTTNLIYNAWGDNTHLYVFDVQGNTAVQGNSSVRPVLTVTYDGTEQKQSRTDFGDFSMTLATSYSPQTSGIGQTTKITAYSATQSLYQLVPSVLYDISNGNMLIKTGDTAYDAYARSNLNEKNTDLASMASKTFSEHEEQPSFIADTVGKNTIIYHPLGQYTQIMVVANALDSGRLKIVSSKRFDRNGIYIPPANTEEEQTSDNEEKKDDKKIEDKDGELLDAFSKWYMYFYGKDIIDNSENSKYLLKTQVVPPVCPACPGCTGQGVCTDCGGNGGAGTSSGSGSLAFSDGKTVVGATGNLVSNTVGATGNVLSNTVGATGDVLSKAVGTTGDVVNKTVDTAGNVVTGVVGKTLDTAGNVVGKTFDTAGNILGSAGRAIGLDRLNLDRVGYAQSYRGPVNTSSSANAQGYNRNTTGYSALPNGNPNDPYSYNGKLQSKGANFIPVTADFSQFRR